jgi:hypothetical protein
VRARGGARARWCRGGLGPEPEPGSRSGTTLAGGPQLSAEEGGEGEKSGLRGEGGPGRQLAARRQKKRGEGWAASERRRERPARAGPQGKMGEGKRERRVGRPN